MDALQVESVAFRYGEEPLLERIDLDVPEGDLLAIIGPNGCGKTTLLRLMAGGLRPAEGRVMLGGDEATSLSPGERARRVAVVPQSTQLAFSFTAGEVVLMGRTPRAAGLAFDRPADVAIARRAMEMTETAHVAGRRLDELSGGEAQRVIIARALAQEASIILLDEPTAFLDLRHQVGIYELLRRLHEDEGKTIVVVSHDLNLAARFGRRVALMAGGRFRAIGAPRDVIEPESLGEVYGVEVLCGRDRGTGLPYILPLQGR